MSHSVGSQQSVVPSGLPMLPGNGFKDPTKIDFKKTLTPFQKKRKGFPVLSKSCAACDRR